MEKIISCYDVGTLERVLMVPGSYCPAWATMTLAQQHQFLHGVQEQLSKALALQDVQKTQCTKPLPPFSGGYKCIQLGPGNPSVESENPDHRLFQNHRSLQPNGLPSSVGSGILHLDDRLPSCLPSSFGSGNRSLQSNRLPHNGQQEHHAANKSKYSNNISSGPTTISLD